MEGEPDKVQSNPFDLILLEPTSINSLLAPPPVINISPLQSATVVETGDDKKRYL
jgi:hypothetical protein